MNTAFLGAPNFYLHMCSRYNHKATLQALMYQLASAGLSIVDPAPNALPHTPPYGDRRLTEQVQIIRPIEDGLQLTDVRWWLIPWYYEGTIKDWNYSTFNAK